MTQTDQQKVPKLRFPGFFAEWVTRQFSEFLIPDFRDVPKPSENYLALGVRSHGKGTFQKPDSEPAKIGMETLYEVRANDLIVNITFAWEGAIAIAKSRDHGGLVSHRFPTYTFDREQVIHEFFEYIIEDRRFRQTLELISPGGAGRNRVLSKKAFITIEHRFPTLPEQRKIAGFLGAVDTKIAQLAEKKRLLEDYKKGCMQQLFSKKIRFKDEDGQEFPDWEEKRLGEVLKIGSGRDYKHLGDGDIPVHGTGGLMTHVDGFLYDGESVCIGRKGTIDKPVFLTGKFWTVDTLFYTHSFKGAVPRFIYAVFQQINWQMHNEASGVPSLSKSTIEKLKVSLPHPDEQRKIADFLSALDRKIDLVGAELEHAKTFKKGLLQQMFV